jgi:hypothetical protein
MERVGGRLDIIVIRGDAHVTMWSSFAGLFGSNRPGALPTKQVESFAHYG